MNKVLRATLVSAVVITTVIGIASFVLSFAALWDLATMAGVPRNLSWLWPVIVDGTILQATISVIALAHVDQHGGRRFFWAVLVIAAMVSVGANAMHAFISQAGTLHPALSAAIATVAPVSLLAATHGLGILVRVPTAQPPAAVATPTATTTDPLTTRTPATTTTAAATPLPVAARASREQPAVSERAPAGDPVGPPVEVAVHDPLEEVDRWILDEDRAEDLFPVEAP